ncbi:MAG: hypothetical protein K6E38_06225 [Fretibacterium sp.]|nr:hypothetical protein [Fretibacterium sp.]
MKRILRKCLPFLVVFLVGIILCLTLTLREEIFALRALGPIALFSGAAGIISETKKILDERAFMKTLAPQRALEHSAWLCFLRDAPKKYRENDITYIPVNGETLKLDTEGLALEYSLLPAISGQAFEALHHKEMF